MRTHPAVSCLFVFLFAVSSARATIREVPGTPDTYPTIQAAIDAANDGDEIVVAPGTYMEVIDLLGKAVHLRSSGGPDVTIIDGTGLDDSVVTCATGEGENTRIDGFTIRNGTGWYDPFYEQTFGGGMRMYGASPTVVDCVFRANSASLWGGGMFIDAGSPLVLDCTFDGNFIPGAAVPRLTRRGSAIAHRNGGRPMVLGCTFTSNVNDYGSGAVTTYGAPLEFMIAGCHFQDNVSRSGGALHVSIGRVNVSRCTFVDNVAHGVPVVDTTGGGAIEISGRYGVIRGCVFEGNTAVTDGGAMLLWRGQHSSSAQDFIVVENCLFLRNTAGNNGGAMLVKRVGPLIANCTIVQNTAQEVGGIHFRSIRHYFKIANVIIWGNAFGVQLGPETPFNKPTVMHSVVQGGFTSDGSYGVLDVYPQFVDPLADDYRLMSGSPCVDAGLNEFASVCGADLDGNERLAGGPAVVDMGVYEFGAAPMQDLNGTGLSDTCEAAGDVDGDGWTTEDDLELTLSNWGPCPTVPAPCFCDTNLDGVVDVVDLVTVILGWTP